jgi:hypothetical protein
MPPGINESNIKINISIIVFLFNPLVMVIVYPSIKNILFNYQQQGNLTFMLQLYFPNSFI